MEYHEPDFDDEYYSRQINTKTCRRCGEDNLHWDDVDGADGEWTGKPKWRLINEKGEIHVCKQRGT